ncbi:MAG: hypothetical protein JXR94_15410 [Candidatus Hydrogenedentes bacterium]|nr:hypothetical protein [Candidatus Hydrogenedentota bacterium]
MSGNAGGILRVLAVALAAVVCAGSPAHAQFDFVTLGPAPDPWDVDLGRVQAPLHRAASVVRAYRGLHAQQREAWSERVTAPYPGAAVPLESDFVDALFALFASDEVIESPHRWNLWYDALCILTDTLPGSPRTAALARQVLRAELPEELAAIPHESLVAVALGALEATGRDEDLQFLIETEKAGFWSERAGHCRMKAPAPLFEHEPGQAALVLRAKAPWILARNRPGLAVDVIESILTRDECAAYREQMEWLLNEARAADEGRSPWGDADFTPIPDPFLLSLSKAPPPTAFELHPVLNHTHMAALEPDVGALRHRGAISEEVRAQSAALSERSGRSPEERIALCRALRGAADLPFELHRWIVLQHVLLAGTLNLPDELQSVAHEYLERYPTDWEHLPEEWRTRRWGEINANLYLRCYLAHVYTFVGNEAFAWGMEERLRLLRQTMEPAFQAEDSRESYVIAARLFYAEALDVLTAKWEIETSRTRLSDAEKAAFRAEAHAARARARQEMMAQYNAAEQALQAMKATHPRTDYARGIVRNPDALLDIVLMRKQALVAKIEAEQEFQAAQTESDVNAAWGALLIGDSGK